MPDKIRLLAREKGLSLTKLEEILGLGNGTIGKWAHQKPLAENLKKVADYFGVSIEYFLEDTKSGGV